MKKATAHADAYTRETMNEAKIGTSGKKKNIIDTQLARLKKGKKAIHAANIHNQHQRGGSSAKRERRGGVGGGGSSAKREGRGGVDRLAAVACEDRFFDNSSRN